MTRYLCNTYDLVTGIDYRNTCSCMPWDREHRKRPISDGQRPLDVCPRFEPIETAAPADQRADAPTPQLAT